MILNRLIPDWFLAAISDSGEGATFLWKDEQATLLIWLPEGHDLDRAGQALSYAVATHT